MAGRVQVLIGYLAVAAIIAGALRHRGTGRAAWLAFAAGIGGNATGILVEAYSTTCSPAPTPARRYRCCGGS